MTTKTVLIAKVLPIRRKDNKFIEIKVKNLGNLSHLSETMTENMITENERAKRKRERLDHLSHEEKIKRRKLHNRAAAQLARDRKKVKMNELQQTVDCLKKQKILLQSSNESLITRCKELEKENSELKQRFSEKECHSTAAETRIDESGPPLEDAIHLLVGDHESDEVLEFLHNCSQQLLDANIDSTEQSNVITGDNTDPNTEFQLESIQDLIQFPQIVRRDGLQSKQFTDNQLDCKALSPISCYSDSGYESANSSQIAFHNQMDDQIDDIDWKQTFSELFPDLI